MNQHRGNWKSYLQLFWTFFRISPLSFGGGFAMVPVFEREFVQTKRWVTSDELADILAASQTIPGAVALNSSAMIGHRLYGVAGAIAAMAGMLLPTFLIVLGLGIGFSSLQHHVKVQAALEGIRPAIVALIVYAGVRIYKTSISDKTSILLMAITAVVLLMQWVSPTLVILVGGLIGMAVFFMQAKLGKQPTAPMARARYVQDDSFFGDGI
ncbi:chromate transporter [Paenibacillus sp. HJGM_3]|uniref:chromate transporter n=1 Tax=Paenibacillus sp. HJGM_3 TaxID=3379816 RepID=UPI00385AB1A3